MITEAEAKTKQCPFSFAVPELRGPDGCGIRQGGPWNCIASDCMGWRKTGQIGIDPQGRKVDRDLDGRVRWHDIGHCGLAGDPNPKFVVQA